MLVIMVRTVSLTVGLAVCQKLVRSQNLSLPFPLFYFYIWEQHQNSRFNAMILIT